MFWRNLFLLYTLLLAFILVPRHMRTGISLLQSDLPGFLVAMLKLAGESVFLTVPVCTGCLREVLLVQCQNSFLSKVPFNNEYMQSWILTGPSLKYYVGGTAEVNELGGTKQNNLNDVHCKITQKIFPFFVFYYFSCKI